jgi:hypothetical protein
MDPTTTTAAPSQTTSALPGGVRNTNPALTFIIGLCIVLLASILNAAGLNLTKLDHVCTCPISVEPEPSNSQVNSRYEQARYQRHLGERIGYAHYGWSACCCICMHPSLFAPHAILSKSPVSRNLLEVPLHSNTCGQVRIFLSCPLVVTDLAPQNMWPPWAPLPLCSTFYLQDSWSVRR